MLLVVGVHTAQAGINIWTSHGPYGGTVDALAIDPSTASTLYAGTSRGAVFDIELLSQAPTPTPTPTPTFTPTPTSTPTNTPTNTLTSTQTKTPTLTYTPSATWTPSNTGTPTATGTFPTRTPTPTFIPLPNECTGEALVCRGGSLQGFPCAVDTDCSGGGQCTRLGAARICANKVYCAVSTTYTCLDNLDCPTWPGDPDDYCPVTSPDPAHIDCSVDGDCGVCGSDSGTRKGWGCSVSAPGSTCNGGTCKSGGKCINGANGCEGNRPFLSSGVAHDHVADACLGSIDFAARGRNYATSQTLGIAMGVAVDPVGGTVYIADAQRVLAVGGHDLEQDFGAAYDVMGQRDSYQQFSSGLTGDCTVAWLCGHLSVNTLQLRLDVGHPVAVDPLTGDVWIGDGDRVVRQSAPLPAISSWSLLLGNDTTEPSATIDVTRAIGTADAIDAMYLCAGGSAAGRPCFVDTDCPGSTCALAVAVADRTANRVPVWLNPTKAGTPTWYLGQPDGTTTTCNTGGVSAQSLCGLQGVAFNHATGALFVSDTGNNRVLQYAPGLSTHATATQVTGQSSFSGASSGLTQSTLNAPQGVAVTSTGALVIADTRNARVLEVTPTGNGPTFSAVYGQTDYTHNGHNASSNGTLCDRMGAPISVAIDGSDAIWVADSEIRRALRFTAGTANGGAAARLFGQPNCTSISYHQPGNPSFEIGNNGGLAFLTNTTPPGVAVVDATNVRIEYWSDSTAARGTKTADAILSGYGANGLAYAGTGHLQGLLTAFGSDVYRYTLPLHAGDTPTRVLGTGTSGTSSTQLLIPTTLRVSASGNIWIVDSYNARVVLACNVAGTLGGVCTSGNSTDAMFDLVLGQTSMTGNANGCSSPTAASLCYPTDVYDDEAHSRVLVVDTSIYGTRLLVYPYPITSGMSASVVLGIPSGSMATWSQSRYGVCHGGSVAGESCNIVDNELWNPSGPMTCVGGPNALLPCDVDGDCTGGVCGCGAGAWCDWSKGLGYSVEGTRTDARVVVHPSQDIVYVSKGPALWEWIGPLTSGQGAASEIGGIGLGRHVFSDTQNAGFTQCQWNFNAGGLEFEPGTTNLWAVQGGTAEIATAVYITYDPAVPAGSIDTACCQCGGQCSSPVDGTCGECGVVMDASCSGTSCATFTPTQTYTPINSPTITPTLMPTTTPTVAPASTPTLAPTNSPTSMATRSPTVTPTIPGTATPTHTALATFTASPMVTASTTPSAAPTVTPHRCIGDCNGDGDVTVNEIITLVNMALGSQPQLSACPHGLPAGITDVSQVNVSLIIQAVNNALSGCA